MGREAMVALEPPRIVVEQPAPCSEHDAAALFAAPFERPNGALAPGAGWVLHVRVRRVGAQLHAVGIVIDPTQANVAQRRFTASGTSCAPLAQALAVWGS